MDPRLLQHYNTELQYLREMGAEFATQFPKIAGRLGIEGLQVSDPYVERLLEGVAFLAARVQLKLDAEYPRFTQSLLEMVHPHYLAPTPAMLVAQFRPDPGEAGLATGRTVPRGTGLQSLLGKGDVTACKFTTAADVTLWPLEVASASYFSYAPDLPLSGLPIASRIKGGVRLRLRTTAGLKFSELDLDTLRVFLGGREDVALKLYELLSGAALGVLVVPPQRPAPWSELAPATAVAAAGFADEEALLPVSRRAFRGFRLLQEYFTFPARFRFVDLGGLAAGLRRCAGEEVDVVVLLGRGEPQLESLVDAGNFQLHCTPALNLFAQRADRIQLSDGAFEYHVVPDRTRPLDLEIYDVTRVVGFGAGSDAEREFQPLYATHTLEAGGDAAYFTLRREPRLPSTTQKSRGARSSYVGTEVFLSLVDPAAAPYDTALRQLSIETRCTNRDLPLQMPLGLGATDFTLDVAAPVVAVRCVAGPSRPYAPLVDGAVAWRAVSHLALNYLSLVDSNRAEGAAALRELLALFATAGDATARRQIEGLRSVGARPVVRRLPAPGPIAFGRGLEITLEVDELAYQGASA
ncbi:MAG: type VI secretion system baseplate subunit TssF, partial [Proteobacteria bacterium]|nr:type VI secretion system baseplate subunit TssF [Pseudomonadota bacterium]